MRSAKGDEFAMHPGKSDKQASSAGGPVTGVQQLLQQQKGQAVYTTNRGARRTVAVSPLLPASMHRDAWALEDFDLRKELYRGAASAVFLATDRLTGADVVLKMYRKRKLSTLHRQQVEREIRIHIALEHAHVIPLWAAFEDKRMVCLVLEPAGGGDLFQQLQSGDGEMTERRAVQEVIAPLLDCLQHLHSRNIIHRDIKPENLLLSATGSVMLADFGMAIDMSAERPVTRVGTLDYLAPEVLNCPDKLHPEDHKNDESLVYGALVDAWAVGILAYELLVGYPPFEHESRAETCANIIFTDPIFPSTLSPDAQSFIKAALSKDPAARSSVSQLCQHPWLASASGTSAGSPARGDRFPGGHLHPGQTALTLGCDALTVVAPASLRAGGHGAEERSPGCTNWTLVYDTANGSTAPAAAEHDASLPCTLLAPNGIAQSDPAFHVHTRVPHLRYMAGPLRKLREDCEPHSPFSICSPSSPSTPSGGITGVAPWTGSNALLQPPPATDVLSMAAGHALFAATLIPPHDTPAVPRHPDAVGILPPALPSFTLMPAEGLAMGAAPLPTRFSSIPPLQRCASPSKAASAFAAEAALLPDHLAGSGKIWQDHLDQTRQLGNAGMPSAAMLTSAASAPVPQPGEHAHGRPLSGLGASHRPRLNATGRCSGPVSRSWDRSPLQPTHMAADQPLYLSWSQPPLRPGAVFTELPQALSGQDFLIAAGTKALPASSPSPLFTPVPGLPPFLLHKSGAGEAASSSASGHSRHQGSALPRSPLCTPGCVPVRDLLSFLSHRNSTGEAASSSASGHFRQQGPGLCLQRSKTNVSSELASLSLPRAGTADPRRDPLLPLA